MSHSLGKEAIASVNGRREKLTVKCLKALKSLLYAVCPNTPKNDIKRFVREIVGKTIALRDAMTKEHAIYRCFFVKGTSFDESLAECQEGDPQQGQLFACVFPGLVRLHRRGKNIGFGVDGSLEVITVMVVKAFVKLDTAFLLD